MNERRVHEPFVFAALAIGLTAGFGYGAIIVAALAFRWPLGTWWIALVQAHGHAQLFGWAGLFVLGVGLFFLPRLRGTTLARPRLAPWALASLVGGIAMRALSQPLLAFSQPSMPQQMAVRGSRTLWLGAVWRSRACWRRADPHDACRIISPGAPDDTQRTHYSRPAIPRCGRS